VKKKLIITAIALTAILVPLVVNGLVMAANYQQTGNGALSGPHYNLNIIGVPPGHEKTALMKYTKGHNIFVSLKGRSKIWLCESGVDGGCLPEGGFQVLDRNGTDNDGALFALPAPQITEREDIEYIDYTVFARALGTPGGKSFTTTCYTDGTDEWCSSISMKLERKNGKPVFTEVSKYLLVIYIDGVRYPLFSNDMDWFWRYDNDGLKLAQLRFYETERLAPPPTSAYISSTVYDCTEPGDQNVDVDITGVNTDFDNVTVDDVFICCSGMGVTLDKVVGNPTATQLTLRIDVDGSAAAGDYAIYVSYPTDSTEETVNTTFTVSEPGTCP